jgi:hypothetical protein
VILAPFGNLNKYGFLAFLIVYGLALLLSFWAYFIPLNKITAIPVTVFSLYCVGDSFLSFIKFTKYDLLYKTSAFWVVLPFVAIVIYISLQKTRVIYKFSLVFWFVVAVVITLFAVFTAKDFEIRNIFIYNFPSAQNLVSQAKPYIFTTLLPVVLLSILAREEGIKTSSAVMGVGLGFLALGVCILNSVLLFGVSLASTLNFPYSSAGSTVTFGNLFTRMDGLLELVYLTTSVIKCGVCIEVIKKSRNKLVP